jgi:hypothetical protein
MAGQGRPSKYKKEFCQKLIDFMAKGFSFEAFSGHIEVNQDTLHEWAKRHPDFSEAKDMAFAKNREFWEALGINGIHNESWHQGGSKSLNASVWIFNMKNRFKWRDRVEHSGGIETDGTRKKLEKLLLNPDLSSAARKLCLELSDDANEE